MTTHLQLSDAIPATPLSCHIRRRPSPGVWQAWIQSRPYQHPQDVRLVLKAVTIHGGPAINGPSIQVGVSMVQKEAHHLIMATQRGSNQRRTAKRPCQRGIRPPLQHQRYHIFVAG